MIEDALLPTRTDAESVIVEDGQAIVLIKPSSNVQNVGTAIAAMLRENNGRLTLRAIGAGAVNQMIKGTIYARQKLAGEAQDLIVKPGFSTVKGRDGDNVTAIVFVCMLQ